MNKAFIGAVALTSSMLAISVEHGGMRCRDGGGGSCVVSVGDDKSALYSCCGSPDMQSSRWSRQNFLPCYLCKIGI